MKPAGWQPIPTLALPLKGRGCLALPPLEGEGVLGSPALEGEGVFGSPALEGEGMLGSPPLEGEGMLGSPPFKGGAGGGMGCGNGWRKCHAPAAAFPLD
jgi:hypothetical protein